MSFGERTMPSSFRPHPFGKLASTTALVSFLALTIMPLSSAFAADAQTQTPQTLKAAADQMKTDAESVGDKIAETAKTAGDTIADTAKTAGETISDAAKTAKEKLSEATEAAKTKAKDMMEPAEKPSEDVSTLPLSGPLHEVTEGEVTTYAPGWTGPMDKPQEFVDMKINHGEEGLAEVNGMLANAKGQIVAVIADPEGFMNLNLGTQDVVLPLTNITYEPNQDVFQTTLTKDELLALPAWN
jgi:gas vesicle protein